MQIKAADDRTPDIDALEALLGREGPRSTRRPAIEQKLKAVHAGIKGERDAAYEIEFYFGRSPNFATIHDLRIEVGGLTAQIDHLILNRLGEIWVCERKHFAEGVGVDEFGEWVRFWNGRPTGIPSPIEQNRRHIFLLQRAFDDGLVPSPKRFGVVSMKPDFRSLVLVSNNARIKRPARRASVPGIDQVIKVEQLRTRVLEAIDQSSPARLLRSMGTDGLEAVARALAAMHRPAAATEWAAQFGLNEGPAASPTTTAPVRQPSTALTDLPCGSCGKRVTFAEAKWCRVHKDQFGGQLLCRDCQSRAVPA